MVSGAKEAGHRKFQAVGRSLATALAAALGVSALACSGGAAKSQQQGPQAMPVKVDTIKSEPVVDSTDYVASLRSRNSAIIMPEVEGRVTKIFVHSGEKVAPGARLMQIDPSKQQASLESQQQNFSAQQATVVLAQQQFDRTKGLFDAGVVSKQELDQAKANLDNSKAQLSSLEAQVNQQKVQFQYYSVITTSGGTVGDIPVRVGDRVNTTTQLTTVDKPGSLEVYVYVPIEKSGDLKLNMPVQILDASGKVIADSHIDFVSPEVDPTTQTILMKAKIDNNQDKLRQSQFISARVIWGKHDNPVVPVLAVSRLAGQYFAFVAEPANGGFVAKQHPLDVGQTVENNYEVRSGLKPGDKLIVSGTQFLVDGMPVVPQG